MTKGKTIHKSFRMAEVTHRRLEALAEEHELHQVTVLEQLIKEAAEREGIHIKQEEVEACE